MLVLISILNWVTATDVAAALKEVQVVQGLARDRSATETPKAKGSRCRARPAAITQDGRWQEIWMPCSRV
jgi:hypothetical protein